MMYAYEPYFHKPPRIDEQFGVGQQFSTKSVLKVKITDLINPLEHSYFGSATRTDHS
jgi:hypothetical protein